MFPVFIFNFFFCVVSLQSKISAAEALLKNDATAAAGVTALKAIINEVDDVAQNNNDSGAGDGKKSQNKSRIVSVCLDTFFFFFLVWFFFFTQRWIKHQTLGN